MGNRTIVETATKMGFKITGGTESGQIKAIRPDGTAVILRRKEQEATAGAVAVDVVDEASGQTIDMFLAFKQVLRG